MSLERNIVSVEITNAELNTSAANSRYFTALLADSSDEVNVIKNYTDTPPMELGTTEFTFTAEHDNTRVLKLSVVFNYSDDDGDPLSTDVTFNATQYGVHSNFFIVADAGIQMFKRIDGVRTDIGDPITGNLDYIEYNPIKETPYLAGSIIQQWFNFHVPFTPAGIMLNTNDEFGIEVRGNFTGVEQGVDLLEHRFRIQGIYPIS